MKFTIVVLLVLVAVAAGRGHVRTDVVCPPIGEEDLALHVPNPDDCSSFYKCGHDGIPYLHYCPPGLEFNAELEVCDFPANAGCSTRKAH